MSVQTLNYQVQGEGKPLVILHGLFGMLQNWGAQAKALSNQTLSNQFQVIAVDLRDHGRSPHSTETSYPLMAADLRQLISDLGHEKVDLLGHSMGGKVAMQLACEPNSPIDKLIIADIAPVSYDDHHSTVFAGLKSVDTNTIRSRQEADRCLSEHVTDPSVRAFLLTNLYRHEGKFAWRANVDLLDRQYGEIRKAPQLGTPFEGQTLFIKGGDSDYILPQHQDAILHWFPKASYKVIAGTGHWPHAEKPELFTSLVRRFLTD